MPVKRFISFSHLLGRCRSLVIFLMACVCFVSCSDWHNQTMEHIKLELWYENHTLNCEQALTLEELLGWKIRQLAFFVSEPTVLQKKGEQALALSNNEWQSDTLALINFIPENCALANDSGSDSHVFEGLIARQYLQFATPVELTPDSRLRFSLSVPENVNHQNPLIMPPPLNIPMMFWSWRGGHKFFRLDLLREKRQWEFHLGSTGCESSSALLPPIKACQNPNRIDVDLPMEGAGQVLRVHLDRLLNGISLQTMPSCLMEPEKKSCEILLDNLQHKAVFTWH